MRNDDEPIEVEIRDVTDLYPTGIQPPPREPIIKNWRPLIVMAILFSIAFAYKMSKVEAEREAYDNRPVTFLVEPLAK